MIVDFNRADQTHVVLVNMGTADEACEPLPLVEYPDAYQVRRVAVGGEVTVVWCRDEDVSTAVAHIAGQAADLGMLGEMRSWSHARGWKACKLLPRVLEYAHVSHPDFVLYISPAMPAPPPAACPRHSRNG